MKATNKLCTDKKSFHISPPWVTFANKMKALFEKDDDIIVNDIEDNTVNFGDNAIDNDINVIVKLTTNTGIDSTIQAGQITDVKYINLAGVASSEPMSGMNLKVTTYSDGSRQVSKVIK